MSIIKFPTKQINKKKMAIFISIVSILVLILILGIIYFFSSSFRAFMDIYIFRKEIKSDNLAYVDISTDEDQYFHANDKYISVLNKKVLYIYNSSGQEVAKNDINISSPIFANNNKFLAIAENNGNTIYMLSGTNIVWQNTLDGTISKIKVNKNGYVSVIITGTSYKSIVISFDAKGNELFKTYLSSNLAIATDISHDNKYLSIAEIDYSGSIAKCMVKNISIEKAKSDPTNSVVSTYNIENNNLLLNIKYQDKGNLIYITSNSIHKLNVSDSTDTEILSYNNEYEFFDINLKNNIVYTFNKNQGFTSIAHVDILNTNTNSLNEYSFKGSIKSLFTNEEKLAINTGSEVHFIGLNGWLIKKYDSYSEINNVILGDSIAGIVCKDKIKILEI